MKNNSQTARLSSALSGLDDSEPINYRIDFQSRRYEYVSATAAQLFGVSLSDFLLDGFELVRGAMLPADWQRLSAHFRELCRERPGQTVTTRVSYALTLADGRQHFFIDRVRLESDFQGNLLLGHGSASDVSAQAAAELALHESEQRFSQLLASLDEMVWCYDVERASVLYVNDAVEKIYGRSREDFLSDPSLWRAAIHPEDRVLAQQADQRVLEEGKAECDCRIVDAEGGIRWLRFSLYRMENEASGGCRVVGVGVDVTDRKRVELALLESEELFHTTMDAAQIGIFVVQDYRMVYVNPKMQQMYGYSAEEMQAMTPDDLTATEMRETVREQYRRRMAGEKCKPYENLAQRRDGSRFPIMVLAALATYKGRPASVGTAFDLTERKEAEQRIVELAFFDLLTRLPNRRLLEDRFGQALAEIERKRGRLALFVIDLDNFKRVNDSLGHSVGDRLLCAVAERVKETVRKGDTVARLGGDEFILVLPNAGVEEAAELARRIMSECTQPFAVDRHTLTVTPSIGISLYPDDGHDFETLLKNADTAMYQAKESGRRNFQFFAANMNVATLERLLLENSLRQALVCGQFRLLYQPLVSLVSGEIVGCEALIRWCHPELGMVSPVRFIPVAEDTGLINAIGDWVLNEACHQAKAWQEAGLPAVTMAVNVSPVQFRQNGFVNMVAGVLAASGLDPRFLELELTERTVMHDAEVNLGTMSALHRMGVELAVDDFGTGYSSLAYLKRFPVGKLKIDQSFVRDIVEDADDLAIASTIVSIGHSLRLNVLAEGVENASQLHLLEGRECDLAQGYHFSMPVEAGVFADLLRRQPFTKSEGKWKTW